MNANTNMGTTVYWHKNQVIVRLKAQLTHPTSEAPLLDPIQTVIGRFHSALADFGLQLIEPALSVNCTGPVGNIDSAFFCSFNPNAHTDMESMQGNGGTAAMGDADGTLEKINKLKYGEAILQAIRQPPNEILQHVEISVDALPHWFKAGTNGTTVPTQGCPISPPIPVGEPDASGQWKLEFLQLSDTLQDATGKGVTVLVLDTLPTPDQILQAADRAGSSNMLLQEMTKSLSGEKPSNILSPAITFNYQSVPDITFNGKRVITGKDIYGRHHGFNMADHGLFIAGMVHDLAPEANIECIRVLNDDGIGDINTLIKALKAIQDRMQQGGDLANRPVVINLSLVVLPPEDDIPDGVTHEILERSQDLLYSAIRCLADQGAIFVASAGNDSDPRMDASEKRFGPRYPAALADQLTAMIPVGAVNQNGDAAMYSNYPGDHGIATYGGDIPKPDPWLPSALRHVEARVDMTDLDALCGIYSATLYPALSMNDPESEYATPNSSAWAYWSGTSFAAPIISALAARILQGKQPKDVDIRQAIIDAAKAANEETSWTGTEKGDVSGPMIMAVQTWSSDPSSNV